MTIDCFPATLSSFSPNNRVSTGEAPLGKPGIFHPDVFCWLLGSDLVVVRCPDAMEEKLTLQGGVSLEDVFFLANSDCSS